MNATLILVELVTVATTLVGKESMVVFEVDALDDADVPFAFVAVTVNVYAVFGVNPDTTIGELEPVPVKPPGLLVTV